MAQKKSASPRKERAAETHASGLERFAETAEAVAATTKKLEKAALLGPYLHDLNDADLARAAR